MEIHLDKEQMITLLSKVDNIVNSIPLDKWPANLVVDKDFDRIIGVNVVMKRCNIFIKDYKSSGFIKVEFKVNHASINGVYKVPKIFKILSPVCRRWNSIKKRIRLFDELAREVEIRKQKDSSRDLFNELYYTQFPEEIDDIILGGDDE